MEPFRRIAAIACALPVSGIDTDQLIPARFMSRSRSEGYGGYLLHDMRRGPDGRTRPDSPLDDPGRRGAQILVARRNFGGGSSREAAVYALVDYGIRCVLAPSFGDIFSGNAVNNGLLPARVTEEGAERLIEALGAGLLTLAVDLETHAVEAGEERLTFEIDPVFRLKLLNGWDDLDLTASHGPEIARYAAERACRKPWTAVPRDRIARSAR